MAPATIEPSMFKSQTFTAIAENFLRNYGEIRKVTQIKDGADNEDTSDRNLPYRKWKKLEDVGKNIGRNKYTFIYKSTDNNFFEDIDNWINRDLSFPVSWRKEEITEPNTVSKDLAKKICIRLYNKYNLRPRTIAPNKEEGLTVFYKHYPNNRSFIVETYNNAEIAALVSDDTNKTTIACEDIKNFDFKRLVELFIA